MSSSAASSPAASTFIASAATVDASSASATDPSGAQAGTAAPATSAAARSEVDNSNRSTLSSSESFARYIGSQWAERVDEVPTPREQARYAAARRQKLSALFPGQRLVIPAGSTKVRNNDCDYPFRAHSAFSWLTGWASDSEPDSVLVMEPDGAGHTATLFFRERAGRDSNEFYANPAIGEFWIGARPSLAQVAGDLDLATKGIAEVEPLLSASTPDTLIVREADPTLTALVDEARGVTGIGNRSSDNAGSTSTSGNNNATGSDNTDTPADDAGFARTLSELRLVKDDYEVAELRRAIAATARGFGDIIAELPRITQHERGERLIEGVFYTRARSEGNTTGYDTIAASGPHACVLHWTRNTGPVIPGDLVLIDAGIEAESLYTADITRTLPVSGTFSDAQRLVYETVREAADAAFAIVKPGIRFHDVHDAAMRVIARRCAEWGLLPVTAEEALQADQQQHRRYMVHGTSHHLGLDVHDCAAARREMYYDGIIEAGMTFTIEPGLYFQPDDLTVPEHLRGIGVRIEDNILVTKDGAENLSAAIPRTAADVEAWLARAGR